MTLCIAAIASSGDHIVCATDTLISSGYTTYDPNGLKLFWIRDWTALWAGTLSLQTDLENAFVRNLESQIGNEPDTIKDCLQRALHSELANFSTAKLLAPYCISMEMFMKERDRFTPERWDEISRQIAEHAEQYDPQMILAGWGKLEQESTRWSGALPTLFIADRDGIGDHSKKAFCAIGSGAAAADATMCFYNYNRQFSLSWAVYVVAAAAFTAQRSLGVGPPSAIWVASRDRNSFFIQPGDVLKIRDEWRKHSPSSVPSSAQQLTEALLAESKPRRQSGKKRTKSKK